MSVFLEASGKLNPNQDSFKQKQSCQTQLLETVHQWANTINAGQSTHAVFIDFSKAFDTVPHERLLLKLDHVGICGPLLRWIRGFLTNHKQLINGSCSDWKRVPSGVPQGSILGPLLFLVYIDDIPLHTHTCASKACCPQMVDQDGRPRLNPENRQRFSLQNTFSLCVTLATWNPEALRGMQVLVSAAPLCSAPVQHPYNSSNTQSSK